MDGNIEVKVVSSCAKQPNRTHKRRIMEVPWEGTHAPAPAAWESKRVRTLDRVNGQRGVFLWMEVRIDDC